MVSDVWQQEPAGAFDPWPEAQVHVEWSPVGAGLAARRGDGVVIVDVLSFSTTLTMAAERGISAYVYSGAELAEQGGPAQVAARLGATCAVSKRDAAPGQISLSPASIPGADPAISTALFSSLNGALALSNVDSADHVAIGCLRNRSAVAGLVEGWLTGGTVRRVTIVACGEHWSSVAPVQGLRPCLEDLLGAGAMVELLARAGLSLSVEARAAASVFRDFDLADFPELIGARELVAAGFADDVTLAGQVDSSTRVPLRTPHADRRCLRPA